MLFDKLQNDYRVDDVAQGGELDNGDVWLDTGTISSLTDAEDFVRVVQTRTGQIVGSPEKTAFQNDWINRQQLDEIAATLKKSGYGEYLNVL